MIAAAQRLSQLMQLPEGVLNLPEAALVIASQEYPDIEVEDYLARIAMASDQLRRRLAADASKTHVLAMLNHLLFDELGYRGASDDYYDPRNSFLNEVMERRVGIPITLCILYVAIGQRVGLPLAGVSFPGHFLVRCPIEGGILVLDPFHRGVSVSAEQLRSRLDAQGIRASDGEEQSDLASYLQVSAKREILARLLRNLKAIYIDRRQSEKAVRIIDLLLTVTPQAPDELLARSRLYQQLECYAAATRDLEQYCRLQPEAQGHAEVQQLWGELRQRGSTLH